MYALDNSPGRIAYVNDEQYLFFSGYSYLGMSHVENFIDLVKDGIDIYGLLHPSARISNTQLAIYNQLEKRLSILKDKEQTVTFSSGYLAGKAVIELFKNDKIYSLNNTHPVLKNKFSICTNNAEDLVGRVNNSVDENIVIALDSVNPLNATLQDFSFLELIDETKKVTFIIDDSHGVGLSDKEIFTSPKIENVNYIITYSLSKAFHINGGGISCSAKVAEQLRLSPFYTASTAIAPFMVHAFLQGRDIYYWQQKKLENNIATFMQLIKDLPAISYHTNLPMFILPEALDDHFFKQHQIIISSFAYPDPNGKKINRIIVNALHTKDDLQKLSDILHQVL